MFYKRNTDSDPKATLPGGTESSSGSKESASNTKESSDKNGKYNGPEAKRVTQESIHGAN